MSGVQCLSWLRLLLAGEPWNSVEGKRRVVPLLYLASFRGLSRKEVKAAHAHWLPQHRLGPTNPWKNFLGLVCTYIMNDCNIPELCEPVTSEIVFELSGFIN